MRGLLACVAAAATVAACPAGELRRDGRCWVRESAGTVAAQNVHTIRVRSDGPVTIRGVAGDSVRWTVEQRIVARTEADAGKRDAGPRVSGKVKAGTLQLTCGGSAGRPAPELTVQVPRDLGAVFVVARGGPIQAFDIDGAVDISGRDGAINLDRIGGSVSARTGGGDIRIGRISGSAYCFTGGGAIRATSLGADGRLETAGGEIFVGETAGRLEASAAGGNIQIGKTGGAVIARTNGGLIQIGNAGGQVTADAGGGAIRVMAPGGARCQTAEGLIRLKDAAGALLAATGSGSIVAELMAGRALLDSNLSTRDGDITVVIPRTSAITVLARNISSGGRGRIMSEFPEIRPAGAAATAPGQMIAEGSLNGGGPVLRITAAGGSIYLRRR